MQCIGIAAPSIPLTYSAALKNARMYRRPLGMDKIKFMTCCNTDDEWKKATTLLKLVNTNALDLNSMPESLTKHLNRKRLQRQLLFNVSLETWEDFEAAYPNHHHEEKLKVLLPIDDP